MSLDEVKSIGDLTKNDLHSKGEALLLVIDVKQTEQSANYKRT